MDYLESIVELKNILSSNFTDRIIPLINKKSTKNLMVSSGLNQDVRNVKGYHLNFETPTNLFYWNFIKKRNRKNLCSL